MRTTMLGSFILFGMTAIAAAQESPGVLTPDERDCEAAMVSAVGGYVRDAGGCLADCQEAASGDTVACDARFGIRFLETRQCLDLARSRVEVGVARECGGAACVDCYAQGQCRQFRDTQLNDALAFGSIALAQIYCDDRFSADGLSSVERRCRSALVKAGGAFVSGLGRCFRRCRTHARARGISEGSCASALLDSPAMDASTQRCVDRMRDRFHESCDARCADAPDCFGYSCSDVVALTETQVRLFEPQVLCGDVPRCGDGFTNGDEECDFASFGSSEVCGFYPNYCASSCTCEQYQFCGDGIVTGTEECEPYGSPTCGSGEACAGCQCVPIPDRCTEATEVPASGGSFPGITSGPSVAGSATCGGFGPEQVFRWIPSESGVAMLSTCGQTFFDTVLHVRTGSCADGVEAACNDQSCGSASSLTLDVTAGETYWVFVDGWSPSSSGFFTLTITPPGGSPSGAFLP